jgi:hypothetical protein
MTGAVAMTRKGIRMSVKNEITKSISPYTGLVLFGLALLSSCSAADEAMGRGSLVEHDAPVMPSRFLGTWAAPKAACLATRDFGVQMLITESMIGNMTITKLNGYSDHSDIVVTMEAREGDSKARETLSLRLKHRDKVLRAKGRHDRAPIDFHRCLLN